MRALRVYERRGLLKPGRSATGWRLYGPSELQRLNIIVTLKALGMTLAQIRSLLKTSPPPLASVLEMQLRACRAKRDEADRAIEFVQAALATIESGRPLALEELCNLTRSMEMGNHRAIARELINEEISPDEERAPTSSWGLSSEPMIMHKAQTTFKFCDHTLNVVRIVN